ncbi:MAG: lyase [Dehalococcoidia bacterium]
MRRRRFLWLAGGAPAAIAVGCGGSGGPSATGTVTPAGAGGRLTPVDTMSVFPHTATPGLTPTATPTAVPTPPLREPVLEEFPVVRGSGPHDVAVQADGRVWYTGQRNGTMGLLDPSTGDVEEVDLGPGASPHGVIIGPDAAAWVTEGGTNAIVRVDPATFELTRFPLPGDRANLNTAAFDRNGVLWFTGQNGFYGRVDPATGTVEQQSAPRGRGPYGICATPTGDIYYASLAGSHIARIDIATGQATPIDPPTANQGARRVWSDSRGRIWVSEWNSGQVSVHDPADGSWQEWKLPGSRPQTYSVFVDDRDHVWLTDFAANTIVRFTPEDEQFLSLPLTPPNAAVRQMLGRPGEVWGAESGADALVVVRT